MLQTIISIRIKLPVIWNLPKTLPGPKKHQWVIHSEYPPPQTLPSACLIILRYHLAYVILFMIWKQ